MQRKSTVNRLKLAVVIGAVAMTFSSPGFAADPGITNSEVIVGMSSALSGPNAGYGVIGQSSNACFDYYNAEHGGVKFGDGKTRKISTVVLDDAMEPARALQNARRLVSQSGVFLVSGNVGTGANLGARQFYNSAGVPHVFLGSGGPMFGAKDEIAKYPWSMLGWLSYNTEAAMYASFVKDKFPNAKIALLNDDSGGPFFADAFVKEAKRIGLNIVIHEEHSYSEPTINAKISRLADSGADVFIDATTPKYVVQAIKQMAAINWKPAHFVWQVGSSIGGVLQPAGVDISKGIYTGQWLKDQSNPIFANDDDMKLYVAKLEKYGSGLNPADQNAAAGWYACHGLIKVFEKMKEPSRKSFMDTIRHLKGVKIPLMLDGITLTTNGEEDGYPIESLQISQFDGVKFTPVGSVVNYEGKTPVYEARVKK